ncbi:MAG: helix-turn-helix domain-containing protein [Lachnospiraceae bacterium]|nr:helix-turn-helix domain-containing protein [Lachnospiraceae bacterium]
MISNTIIQKTMEEMAMVTGAGYALFDDSAKAVMSTLNAKNVDPQDLKSFIDSGDDHKQIGDSYFFRVMDEDECAYILAASCENDPFTMGKVAVCQLQNLIIAYKDRTDRNNFFQNLIMDNLLLVDIHNRAQKLHIENEKKRMVFLVEVENDRDNIATRLMRSLFVEQGGNYITSVDDKTIILIKDIEDEDYDEIAHTIVDMLGAEAMLRVRVSYGLSVLELKNISKCYKEAKMALEVGSIFHSEKNVLSYETLGIGRLIYQLPVNLCKIFVKEVFGDTKPEEIDEETLTTIHKFFENNLNVSETARQLYIHRNTLVYRMEKLQKLIGLDMRIFDDAVTFKIVMMVVDYVNYLEKMDNM